MDDNTVKQPEFDRSINFITESIGEVTAAVKTLAEVSARNEVNQAAFMEHVKTNQERHDNSISDIEQRVRPLENNMIENNLKWKLTTFLSGSAVVASISAITKMIFFS